MPDGSVSLIVAKQKMPDEFPHSAFSVLKIKILLPEFHLRATS